MNALKTWALRHAQTAVGTLGRLSQQWLQSSFMILVIGIALALPACLQVALINARLAGGDWNRAIEVSVYFKVGTALNQAEQAAAVLRKRDDVSDVRIISADAGLTEFRKRSGFGEALTALNENPLPHALVVRPNLATEQTAELTRLTNDLRQLSNVEVVQLDAAWVERFNAMVAALRRTTSVIAALLGLAVIIVVGNAIRVDIQARRDEIEVTKLVGGSDAFVRRPFLYTGIWYGLMGGILALVITYLVLALVDAPVRKIALLYGSHFELAGLGLPNALSVLGVAIVLAWLGSYVAATRHLRAIEPK